MGLLDKFVDKKKIENLTLSDPRAVFGKVLQMTSGTKYTRDIKFDMFYKIYAFKGVCDGIGTSTVVANTALAIASLGLTVCVFDTSMLTPTQDVLLKTQEYKGSIEQNKMLDWFDMPYTKKSVLHVSTLNGNISVLGFFGKHRMITDVLSTKDSGTLVDIAITQLINKFDVILIDCCAEFTNVNVTALQQAQQVIQVWEDSPQTLANIDNFITNLAIESCPLDKMRWVVLSRMNKEVLSNAVNDIIAQYRCHQLAYIEETKAVSFFITAGKNLWTYASMEKEIEEFNTEIIRVALHILNVDMDDEAKKIEGSITSNDIMDGKVDGTVTKKIRDRQKKMKAIIEENPKELQEPVENDTFDDISADDIVEEDGEN